MCRFLNPPVEKLLQGIRVLGSSVSVQMWLPNEKGMSLLGVLSCPGNVMKLVIFQIPNFNFPKLFSQSSSNCKLARWVEKELSALFHS